MNVENKKNRFSIYARYTILFIMFMYFALASGYANYFVGVTIIIVLLLRNVHRLQNLKSIYVFPFWLFVVYGLFVTLLVQNSNNFNLHDFFRGFFGLTNFLVFFILGKLLSLEWTRHVFFKTMVFFGIIYSFYLFINMSVNMKGLNDFSTARDNMGTPIFLTFILMYILFDDFFEHLLSIKMRYTCALVNVLAILTSFSRTTYMCLVALIPIFILFSHQKKVIYRALAYTLILLVSFAVFINMLPAEIKVTLTEKIFNSINETSSRGDWNSISSVNTDWRGFEKYSALQQFTSSNTLNKFIGNGVYSGIYIGNLAVLLGITSVYIPYLHNSYYTILIKEGVFGVCIYLFFFVFNAVAFILKTKKNIMYLFPVCLITLLMISSYVTQGVIVAGHDALIIVFLGYLSSKRVIEQ